MILLQLILLQGPGWHVSPAAPAVGDTVHLTRAVPVAGVVRPRLQPLARSATLEPLADPTSTQRDSTLVIRYDVAFFATGTQAIPMPPLELRYATGRTDVVEGDTARVRVQSVLPGGDTLPSPKASAAPIARAERRPWMPVVFATGVSLLVMAWGWRRRRVRAPKPVPGSAASSTAVPVERWVAAGESRAVAALAGAVLRGAMARVAPEADRSLEAERAIQVLEQTRPDWPLRELADVLRALERATFAPAVGEDVMGVARRADALARDLAARGSGT